MTREQGNYKRKTRLLAGFVVFSPIQSFYNGGGENRRTNYHHYSAINVLQRFVSFCVYGFEYGTAFR